METPYNSEQWDELSKDGKRFYIHNFFLSGSELSGWKLHDRIAPLQLETGTLTSYIWINEKDEKQMLRLDTLESDSVQQAHEGLKDVLGNVMHPGLTQLDHEKGGIGDISYGTGTDETNSLFFSRSNLVFRLLNMTANLFSVNDIGAKLDSIITEEPTASEKGVIPEIAVFATGSAKAGSPAPIRVEAKDPIERPIWLKFVIDSGELSRINSNFLYSNATAGKHDIKLYATNENGFVGAATAVVELD